MEDNIYLIYHHGQTRELHNFRSFSCPQLVRIVNGTPAAESALLLEVYVAQSTEHRTGRPTGLSE